MSLYLFHHCVGRRLHCKNAMCSWFLPAVGYLVATVAWRLLSRQVDPTSSVPRSTSKQILSDPEKRAIYDQYGEEGLKGMPPLQFPELVLHNCWPNYSK
uniref:Uncharacterized protein n=1 Tax=Zea mays TaxID=4577 RepID=A0A804MJ53_MAIZE